MGDINKEDKKPANKKIDTTAAIKIMGKHPLRR